MRSKRARLGAERVRELLIPVFGIFMGYVFWLIVLSIALWLTRRFIPKAEPILWLDLGGVTKRFLLRHPVIHLGVKVLFLSLLAFFALGLVLSAMPLR